MHELISGFLDKLCMVLAEEKIMSVSSINGKADMIHKYAVRQCLPRHSWYLNHCCLAVSHNINLNVFCISNEIYFFNVATFTLKNQESNYTRSSSVFMVLLYELSYSLLVCYSSILSIYPAVWLLCSCNICFHI